MANHTQLAAAWRTLWQRIGARGSGDDVFHALAERYGEPHRAYHTLDHIAACLEWFEECRHLAEYPDEVALGIWFHDAIYDPRSKTNELQSAALACELLKRSGVPHDVIRRVDSLIMATAHGTLPLTLDEQLLVDIDFSILGADPETFDAYCRGIRIEYSFVPAELYRAARSQILREFLERDYLFATRFFQMRLGAKARLNLSRAIAALENRPDAS